jgi:hypothetical protein
MYGAQFTFASLKFISDTKWLSLVTETYLEGLDAHKLADEKDLKRACVMLPKGREVVRPGYSRLIGAATKVTDRGDNSGNPNRVNWVSKTEQHCPCRDN